MENQPEKPVDLEVAAPLPSDHPTAGKIRLYVIRHAESEYNAAMKTAIRLDRQSFAHEEDRVVKFCPDYIDCGVSEKGYKQCEALREELAKINFKYVIVSPLKRALITTSELFSKHPSNPKVIVEPMMTEMLLSNCDVGGNVLESRTRFNYDFSFLDTVEHKKLWVLDGLPRRNEILKMIEEKTKNKEDFQANGPQILVKLMDDHFPEAFESVEEAKNRSLKLRILIKNHYETLLKPGEEMALILHYRTGQCLTATKFDQETHKPIDGLELKNARLTEFWL